MQHLVTRLLVDWDERNLNSPSEDSGIVAGQSLGFVSGGSPTFRWHTKCTRLSTDRHTPEIEDQISGANANQCGLEGNGSAGTRSKSLGLLLAVSPVNVLQHSACQFVFYEINSQLSFFVALYVCVCVYFNILMQDKHLISMLLYQLTRLIPDTQLRVICLQSRARVHARAHTHKHRKINIWS